MKKANAAVDEMKNTIENYNKNTKNESIILKQESDTYDKIAKLKKLLDSNAIMQEEYNNEKSKLLNQENK